jgi:hypothetical protein
MRETILRTSINVEMLCKSLDDTKNNIENLQERVIILEKNQNLYVGKITVILIVIGAIVTTLLNHFLMIFER